MHVIALIAWTVLMAGLCQATDAAILEARAGGGWQTVGLPYTARVSADGYLESVVVGGFDFLAPSAQEARGLFVSDGGKRVPVTSVQASTDSVVVANAGAEATLRFAADGIHVTARNIACTEGHCLRLEVSKELARIKSPVTGLEYALPLSGNASERMRLMARNGAALTLSGDYLYAEGDVYMVKLPWMRAGGPEAAYTLEVSTSPRLEDLIVVTPRAATPDFVYTEGGKQTFYTTVSNVAPGSFRATVVLTLRHYLHKESPTELRHEVKLGTAAAVEIPWTLENLEPGLYIAEIGVARRGEERGICAYSRFVYNAAALQPQAKPDDFDAFWARTLEEQAQVPVDLHIKKVKEIGNSDLLKFDFAGLLGYRCYGFLTVPRDTTKRNPAVLVLPSSGLHSIVPPVYGDNVVGMAINISNVDVDLPNEQYDWRTWPAPYLVTGILDKDYYSLRFSYAAIVRAAELLAARPEVDAGNILVMGSSQGGGLALVAAGLYPKFKAALANVPALCRLDWNFEIIKPEYFPIASTPGMRPMILRTLAYYDAVHFAPRIRCPTWVSVGLFDDVTPAMNVFCAYNAIPTAKELRVQPLAGHSGGLALEALKGVWPE